MALTPFCKACALTFYTTTEPPHAQLSTTLGKNVHPLPHVHAHTVPNVLPLTFALVAPPPDG